MPVTPSFFLIFFFLINFWIPLKVLVVVYIAHKKFLGPSDRLLAPDPRGEVDSVWTLQFIKHRANLMVSEGIKFSAENFYLQSNFLAETSGTGGLPTHGV